jgi:hypothetical protein
MLDIRTNEFFMRVKERSMNQRNLRYVDSLVLLLGFFAYQ